MEIFGMVRGHFALLIGKPLKTPVEGKEFHISSINTPRGEWQIVLNNSKGNEVKIYISDILRVYTFIVSSANYPPNQVKIDDFVQNNCLSKAITSYVIPLIATFSDVEMIYDPDMKMKFIS